MIKSRDKIPILQEFTKGTKRCSTIDKKPFLRYNIGSCSSVSNHRGERHDRHSQRRHLYRNPHGHHGTRVPGGGSLGSRDQHGQPLPARAHPDPARLLRRDHRDRRRGKGACGCRRHRHGRLSTTAQLSPSTGSSGWGAFFYHDYHDSLDYPL